jgi:hypothetical protein
MYNSDLPNRAELPTSGQLIRSTMFAIILATVLLVGVVLPAEYAIDPTGVGRLLGLTQMGEIKLKLAEEAKAAGEAGTAQAPAVPAPASPPKTSIAPAATETTTAVAKSDEMTVTLKPGEAAEIKLEMVKGAKVKYEWTATGGVVNHDTHGDNPQKQFTSYKKGTGVSGDTGDLVADFDGSHGWFWRNRGQSDVTVTIKASGAYQTMKRVA